MKEKIMLAIEETNMFLGIAPVWSEEEQDIRNFNFLGKVNEIKSNLISIPDVPSGTRGYNC